MREPTEGPERADLEESLGRPLRAALREWITLGLAAVGLVTAIVTAFKYALS